MLSMVSILAGLRRGLEDLRFGVGTNVVEKLCSEQWQASGYMPALRDLLSGSTTVEQAIVQLVERHDPDSVESGVLARVMSARLEELASAARHDAARTALWDRIMATLARHCVASSAQLRESDAQARVGREGPGNVQLSGISDAARNLRKEIAACARGQGNILVTGETGVGKERVVRAIHSLSLRGSQPFVAINCAAIAPGLVDSELFGHRKGSFTGADRDHQGVFRAAHHGTLFLDEVAEMPLESQAKLLRVLEARAVRAVGEVEEHAVDVRVISATNRDVDRAVEKGELRRDLYYRLHVHQVMVPPLRERVEDIPLLVAEFLAEFAERGQRVPRQMTANERREFVAYPWPGNIRQLRGAVEEWADRAGGEAFVLPVDVQKWHASLSDKGGINGRNEVGTVPMLSLESHLEEHVRRALLQADGNRARAAEILGISRSRLYRVLERSNDRDIPKARRGRPRREHVSQDD